MLPATYLERLTQAMGVRMDRRASERRKASRIPASFRPEVFPVQSDRIEKPYQLRARDISASGVGIILTKELSGQKSIVLRVTRHNSMEELVMLCVLRRTFRLDSICLLGGVSFEKVLYPGQAIVPGQKVSDMLWADVSGEKPGDDPFEELKKAG
jgi:hypothetical protein